MRGFGGREFLEEESTVGMCRESGYRLGSTAQSAAIMASLELGLGVVSFRA